MKTSTPREQALEITAGSGVDENLHPLRGVLERLAHGKKAAFELSREAVKALVALAPEDEKVGLLVARLRASHAQHSNDL